MKNEEWAAKPEKKLNNSQVWALSILGVFALIAVVAISSGNGNELVEAKSNKIINIESIREAKNQREIELGEAKLNLTFGECINEIKAGRDYNCPDSFIYGENLK